MNIQVEKSTQNSQPSIIWVDRNVFSKENKNFMNQLGYNWNSKPSKNNSDYNVSLSQCQIKNTNDNTIYNPYLYAYTRVDEAINHIKAMRFSLSIIIVSGSYFFDFVNEFQKNINDIYIIPKIIVFTSQTKKNSLLNEIKNNKNIDEFYRYVGIHSEFDKIKKYIEKEQNKFLSYENDSPSKTKTSSDVKFIFEQVNNKEELVLPIIFNKIFIGKPDYKSINDFNKELCKYHKDEKQYKYILNQIADVKNIPIEIISKYYARIYTIEGKFYKDMKINLLEGNEENYKKYKAYIKTMFEACERGALKTDISGDLYSAQSFSEEEIKTFEEYDQKINACPELLFLLFSKSFLSFSKDKNVAEDFFKKYNKNVMLTLVEYDKKNNLNMHADIEDISQIPKEKEVLFFPFASFGFKRFKKDPSDPKRHNLKLIYLGKYIQEFEKDKNIILSEKTLPNTKFKEFFEQSGLIKEEKKNIFNEVKIKEVFKDYETYKSSKNKCSKKWWFFSLFGLLLLFGLIKLKSKDSEKNCQKNYYYDNSNSKCLPCAKGYFSSGGASYCSRCPYGQSSYGDGTNCFNCSVGTFSNYYYEECKACSAGYYAKEGSSSCSTCPGEHILMKNLKNV